MMAEYRQRDGRTKIGVTMMKGHWQMSMESRKVTSFYTRSAMIQFLVQRLTISSRLPTPAQVRSYYNPAPSSTSSHLTPADPQKHPILLFSTTHHIYIHRRFPFEVGIVPSRIKHSESPPPDAPPPLLALLGTLAYRHVRHALPATQLLHLQPCATGEPQAGRGCATGKVKKI